MSAVKPKIKFSTNKITMAIIKSCIGLRKPSTALMMPIITTFTSFIRCLLVCKTHIGFNKYVECVRHQRHRLRTHRASILITRIYQHQRCVLQWHGHTAIHLAHFLIRAVQIIQQHLLGTLAIHLQQGVLIVHVRLYAELLLYPF